MSKKSNFRNDIQIFRGVAVIAVLFFHAFESVFPLGFLGVDVFFVISGYVIAPLIIEILEVPSLKMSCRRLVIFLRNRFFRLAPALGAALLFSAFIIFVTAGARDISRFATQGIYTLLLAGNLGAYRTSGDYFNSVSNPLIHTWSLAVEQQIYILLPIFLLFFHVLISRKYPKAFLFNLILISCISLWCYFFPNTIDFLYLRIGINESGWASFYLPTSRLWEFLVGMITFGISTQLYSRKFVNVIPTSYISKILFILLFLPFHLDIEILPALVVFLTSLCLLRQNLQIKPLKVKYYLTWLGDRSYSIYLLHLPLLYIPIHSPLWPHGSMAKHLGAVLALIVSIILGHLLYKWIETPLRVTRYKEIQSEYLIGRNLLKTISLLIAPLIVFSLLILGSQNRYFGLDRSQVQPAYAGYLDPNCMRDSRDGPPCHYLLPGASKTVLLIGDSHAGHLSQAVVDSSKLTNWNSIIWTHSSCRFELFYGVPDWCQEINRGLLEFIFKESPDLVLLSQSLAPGIDVDSAIRSIRRLELASRKLIIINQTPVFKDLKFMDPGTLFQEPYRAPAFENMDLKDEAYMKIANEIYDESNYRTLSLLDLNENFCTKKNCRRWIAVGWLYRDRNHLSPLGASLVIDDLVQLLRSQ